MKESYNELNVLFNTVLNSKSASSGQGGKNFLEMGGDSVKAMHLVAEARKLGYDLSMEDILSNSSIEELKEKGKKKNQKLWEPFTKGTHELSFDVKDGVHVLSFTIKKYDSEAYEKTLDSILESNCILRAKRNGREVTVLSKEEYYEASEKCCEFEIKEENGEYVVTLKADAAVCDYRSLRLVYRRFEETYSKMYEKEDMAEAEKTVPYLYWNEIQKKYRDNYCFFHEFAGKDEKNTENKKHESVKANINKEKSVAAIFECYQKVVAAGNKSGDCFMNFYNSNRLYKDELADFSKTVGNYEVPSQYFFGNDYYLNYEELLNQNNHYYSKHDGFLCCGFEYVPEDGAAGTEYFGPFSVTCEENIEEDSFLRVYEEDGNYGLELFAEDADKVMEELLSKIEAVSDDCGKKNYGNVGGTAKDEAVILEKFGEDNVERIYRLTDVQKGMLFNALKTSNNHEYKMQYHVHMGFYMDEELVLQSIKTVARKYPALRTSIVYRNMEEPMQAVLRDREPVIDVVTVNGEITDELINKYVERDLERTLDMEDSPLFAVTIINNYKSMEMIWNFHHILMDGWSLPIVFGDFHQYYENLLYGEDIEYAVTDSYERHINKLYSKDINAGMKFWNEYLADYDEDTAIVPVSPKETDSLIKERYVAKLSTEERNAVQEMANENGVTMNTVVEAVLGIVLQKYTCSNDVVIGKVTSGRDMTVEGVEKEVGLFVNTIPVRVNDQNYTVRELLEKLKENDIRSNQYDYCSLAQIVRETGRNPINMIYAYENFMNAEALADSGDNIKSENLRDDTNYDISFVINNSKDFEWDITYNSGKYQKEEIERLAGCIVKVITELPKELDSKVSEISIVSEKDKNIILNEFNNTKSEYPKDKTVSELFAETVEKYSDKDALYYYDKSYTYKELDEMSDRFAEELRSNGVGEGDHVCFMAYKVVETIAYLIAILKLGGVYIPLDPNNPSERNSYIADNSDAVALIDCKGENKYFPERMKKNHKENREAAYMMYTSGTSGEPKACIVTHKGIIRLVRNTNYMTLDETTHMMSGSSMAFDASTLEIWGALLNGGTLALLDTDDMMSAEKLDKFTKKYDVNTMFITTSLFNQLMDTDPTILSSLRELATGGEKMSEKHAKLFMDNHPDTKFMNVYGPTENTTFTTFGEVDLERITLGKPIMNTTVFIMNGNELCPIGVYGELCTGGDGVAKGYYKNDELTAKVFIDNPFGEGTLYRTGDKARFLPNGEIEFAGRIDHQVKIRGFRIEPEEISKKIQEIDGIEQCVTVIDGEKKIKAYFVAKKEFTGTEVFEILRDRLPDYMVPRYYMQLETIPVNINGKTDYKKLPDIEEPIKRLYVAPKNENERKMAEAFEKVLSLKNVGMEDDFIELGGNSLLAVQLANVIEQSFGVRIELNCIMSGRTPQKILTNVLSAERSFVFIPKAEEKEKYEMSSVQKRMFVLQKTNPESTQYNIPLILKFKKPVDVEKMTEAVKCLVNRHEALRTKFSIEDEVFYQNISSEEVKVDIISENSFEEAWNRFYRPFDLCNELPFRAAVCTVKEDTYLFMDMHHIVSDGASTTIIMRDLLTLYNGGELTEDICQYKDYSEWLRSYDFDKEKKYWMKQFEEEVVPLDLPFDYERSKRHGFEGKTIQESFISEDIKAIAEKCQVTEYTVFLAAWFLLLHLYTRQEDMTVGTPVVGRVHPEINRTVGMFVNTLPIRVSRIEGLQLEEFIKKLGKDTYESFENQEYPLYEIIEALGIQRDTDRDPLFDVVFALRDQRDGGSLEKLGVETVELSDNTSKFDLMMEVSVNNDSYNLSLEYSTGLFKDDTAERILKNYICTLKTLKNNIQSLTEDIEIIREEEKKQILEEFNDTTVPYDDNVRVEEVFDRLAGETPDKVALAEENREITYKEAAKITDSIAATLIKKGVQPNDVVAIEATKVANTILLFIGAAKAGAVYVPIEPEMPIDKVTYILNDSKAKVLIAGNKAKYQDLEIEYLDRDETVTSKKAVKLPSLEKYADDCVYYLYTSGTTGNPKGTMITHHNLMRAVRDNVGGRFTENDIDILTCSLAFDGSAYDVWGTLMSGGTLHIIPMDIIVDHKKFGEKLREYGVNSLFMTTSLFHQFVENDPTVFNTVKNVRVGGERLSEQHVRRLKEVNKNTSIINIYGPTENTIVTTACTVPDEFEKISIGKPINNTQVYILQKNKMVGIGVYGELCTSGEGVGKGYLNNPKLTKEKFVPNPYGKGVMYRTGDLARFLPDGSLDYLGRIDTQVKIRGFRIELAGIESVLQEYPGIRRAAVIAYEKKILKAYFVSDNEIDTYELFCWMKKKLPSYMVPSYYMRLDRMPLTSNGKLDYKKLPENKCLVKAVYVEPKTNTEWQIAAMFKEILDADEIGAEDNFFEMGGHSLKATLLCNMIEEKLGAGINVGDIFTNPTVSQLAAFVDEMGAEARSLVHVESKEKYEASALQKSIYFSCQMGKNKLLYNMPMLFASDKRLDVAKVKEVFYKLIERHETLRTRYVVEDGLYQIVEPVSKIDFNVSETSYDDFVKPFDLSEPLMIHVAVAHEPDKDYLCMDVHHIAADGFGMSVLIGEFLKLYSGGSLEDIPFTYCDYSEWMKGRDLEKQKQYWMNLYEDEVPVLNLFPDKERVPEKLGDGKTKEIQIPDILAKKISELAKKRGMTDYMFYLAVAGILLGKYGYSEDFSLGTVMVNRTNKQLEKIVGMFANTLALRISPKNAESANAYFDEVRNHCVEAIRNQEYPYEMLVDDMKWQRTSGHNPMFDVMFIYEVGLENSALDKNGFHYVDTTTPVAKVDLAINMNKTEHLLVKFEYDQSLFMDETIDRMLRSFVKLLESIAENDLEKTSLSNLSMIDEAEKKTILEDFNNTANPFDGDMSIGKVFDNLAKEQPDVLAIKDDNHEYTYGQVKEISDSIAARLMAEGIKNKAAVAFEAEKKAETILVMLGIAKAGAVYVPIEPTMPEEKAKYMFDNCKAKMFVGSDANKYPNVKTRFMLRDDLVASENKLTRARKVDSDQCVYYLFTSGTTGNPKATMITHHNLMRLVRNTRFAPYSKDSRTLNACSLAFDASAQEVWGTLLSGGSLFMITNNILVDGKKLHEKLVEYNINTLTLPTALFHQLLETTPDIFETIRYFRVGGEKMSESHVRRFKEVNRTTVLLNEYGPTENTTLTTAYVVPDEFEKIYIGTPVDNTQVYIMSGNTLCGIGVYGELCTSGDGVSKGYLNNEKLTAEKFVPNPFGEGMMYRTGDIARYLPDGNIEFLGRADSQVKIRGYRIELNGIESALKEYEGIRQAAVIVHNKTDLKAYFVADKDVDTYELFCWMKTKLPTYMVPNYYMQLPEMPVTTNGKLDYRKLPENNDVVKTKYVPLETETEKEIAKLYEELLEVSDVGAEDNFFEMGGHSLKATVLCNKLEEKYHIAANVGDVFVNPTVRQMATFVDNAERVNPEDGGTPAAEREYAEFYVKPYQFNAFADYVISSHPDYEAWNNNNYIQMIGNAEIEKTVHSTVEYYTGTVFGRLPMLDINDLSKKKEALKTEEERENFTNGLLDVINNKHCLYMMSDHYYLSNSEAYQKEHVKHDVLAYEYADGKIGYFESVGGMYGKFSVDAKEFFEAYYGTSDPCTFELSCNEKFSYKFDLKRFTTMLEDYAFARDSRERWNLYICDTGFISPDFYRMKDAGEKCFGVEVFKTVRDYSLNYKETSVGIDYRMYYILFEHDQKMLEKLQYCCEHGYIDPSKIGAEMGRLGELVNELYMLLTKVIQFNYVDPTDEQVKEVVEKLMSIYSKEKELYIDLFNRFKEDSEEKEQYNAVSLKNSKAVAK